MLGLNMWFVTDAWSYSLVLGVLIWIVTDAWFVIYLLSIWFVIDAWFVTEFFEILTNKCNK